MSRSFSLKLLSLKLFLNWHLLQVIQTRFSKSYESFSIARTPHMCAKPTYQHSRCSEYKSFNRGRQKRGFPGAAHPKGENNPFSFDTKAELLLLPSFLHFSPPPSTPLSLPTLSCFNPAKPLSWFIKGKQ